MGAIAAALIGTIIGVVSGYAGGRIDAFLMLIAVLAFILLIFTFGTHQSIWMPIYDFMQFIMGLILVNITFPPNLLYSIRSSLASAFTFLPNYFGSLYSDAPFS